MRLVEGCDSVEFSRYLAKIGQYIAKGEFERLEVCLESKIFNLIVLREDDEIIGHAIWHESNTEEHRRGDSQRQGRQGDTV